MGYNCCVPQCCSDSGRKEKNVKFHQFPKSDALRKVWIVNLRTGKQPSKHAKVCSLHFSETCYDVTSMGEWRILKATAVPTLHLPKRSHDSRPKQGVEERKQRLANRVSSKADIVEAQVAVSNISPPHLPASSHHNRLMQPGIVEEMEEVSNAIPLPTAQNMRLALEDALEVETPSATNTAQAKKSMSSQTFKTPHDNQLVDIELLSEEELKYFSGFEFKRFETIFLFVSKDITNIPIVSCSPKNQLLITLCKYRHNLDDKMLAFLFRIPCKQVSEVFSFWTMLVFRALKSVDFWALGNQDVGKHRAIIDCIEIPIEKSEDPEIHQSTYSQDKNRPTFKCLIGIDESGTVIYCSDAYGGSTSDRQIVSLSGFLDLVKDGETVLADRGFEISDLLGEKGVALSIPPVLRGKRQPSETEVIHTRKQGNRRIHVDRVMGLSKQNAILNEPMSSHLWGCANEIIFNCSMLCNFKPKLVNGLPKHLRKRDLDQLV